MPLPNVFDCLRRWFVFTGGFSFNSTPNFSFGGGNAKPGVISFSANSQQVRTNSRQAVSSKICMVLDHICGPLAFGQHLSSASNFIVKHELSKQTLYFLEMFK